MSTVWAHLDGRPGGTEPGGCSPLTRAETKLMLGFTRLKADGLSRYRSAMDREGKDVHGHHRTGPPRPVAELVRGTSDDNVLLITRLGRPTTRED